VAMRATISLPLIFPPVEFEGQVLVDGGTMNNVPADVVRAELKATRVIAINVGDLEDREKIDYSMLGLAGEALDAMVRANSQRALDAADVVINVPLKAYGFLDWRRHRELIAEGHKAAEAMKDDLLPLAVDEAAWRAWLDARAARRRTTPVPTAVVVKGAARNDTQVMESTLARHVGRPLDVSAIEADITKLGGLDRYQSLTWSMAPGADGDVLEVHAQEKEYGPPFMLLGFRLENTRADEFQVGFAGRYIGYDLVGSGSELRLDAAVGSDPSAVIELYRPLFNTPLFVAPNAGAARWTLNEIEDGRLLAAYRETRRSVGLDAGVNAGRIDEIRLGVDVARLDVTASVGDPGQPEVGGREALARLQWTHDGQDSPVVPSHGLYLRASARHFLDAAEPTESATTTRSSTGVTQAEIELSRLWSVHDRGRLFVSGGAGTSFDGSPLPTEQFALGGPFRLGAFNVGEKRGDHFLLASGGYLHQAARLPDFLGGPFFVGGWLDAGAAYDAWKDAESAVHVTAGAIVDTLLGPGFVAVSAGFDGRWRAYVGIGRVFN